MRKSSTPKPLGKKFLNSTGLQILATGFPLPTSPSQSPPFMEIKPMEPLSLTSFPALFLRPSVYCVVFSKFEPTLNSSSPALNALSPSGMHVYTDCLLSNCITFSFRQKTGLSSPSNIVCFSSEVNTWPPILKSIFAETMSTIWKSFPESEKIFCLILRMAFAPSGTTYFSSKQTPSESRLKGFNFTGALALESMQHGDTAPIYELAYQKSD
mmetsp:Transcript_14299/g.25123  ORF Transcript_14299/g.25123 Transcript_14299/m.25123 type:complete len:212 (+) Transcript_14299:305-940(+)